MALKFVEVEIPALFGRYVRHMTLVIIMDLKVLSGPIIRLIVVLLALGKL